jgi:hypothetical protein
MRSPHGWQEPGQRPEFEEITIVLLGMLRVETCRRDPRRAAGQASVTEPGEWVRYSTPEPEGARVHRRLPARVFSGHGAPGISETGKSET